MQLKPNRWSCSITAMAMALETPVQHLIEHVGHDGSEIVFPQLKDPMYRRGFHSQELIQLAWDWGYAVTPFELAPTITSGLDGDWLTVSFPNEGGNFDRFTTIITVRKGVLEGRGKHCNHAVHFQDGIIYDPDGHVYAYSRKNCEDRNFYGVRALVVTKR